MRNITKFLMLVVLCLVGMQGNAQNVTVHPGNGSMLPARKSTGGDTFYGWNGFATWKHNQLGLTMTVGDSNNNTQGTNANGQLQYPANDIFATAASTSNPNAPRYLQLGKGMGMNTYMTIALPKGYRITGYTITFHRISQPNGASGNIYDYERYASFGETNSSFTYRTTTNSTTQRMTSYRGLIPQGNTTQYTIGRTSQTETDMGNVLYFKLGTQNRNGNENTPDYRAFIQFDHLEIFFTAEADYAPVTPTTSATNQSAVDISFTTSKMDYGQLTYRTDGSTGRISYNGNINDLNANLTLYEDGSVEHTDDNGFDGTAGDIVKYQSGSISSAGNYFKLEGSQHGKLTGEGEAIYYLETPIWVTSGSGTNTHRDPIGYRIVGATIDYAAGTDNTYYPATFYIRYESTGHGEGQDGIYGLNYYSGEYNWNYQTVWRIDEQGYIFWGTSALMYYLAVGDDGKINVVTEKPSDDAGTFEVVDGKICRKNDHTQYIGWEEKVATIIDDGGNEQIVYEEDEDGNPTDVPKIIRSAVITESEDYMAYYDEQTPAGGGTTGKYTLRIYDPTGTKVIAEKVVEGTGGSINVSDYTDVPYNNDAIKIGIIGTGLINGHLTLQALDPYIDHIDIVCQEQGTGNGGRLTQQFTATDFSVRGGKFTFYVPEDFEFPAQFTFENLYSKYGDETYYNTPSTNHGRYYFLGSTYSDYEDNDVYDRYNNTAHRNADYTTKVNCLQPGTRSYTFNNAATVTTGSGGYYQEYPFTVDLYQKAGGDFEDFIFTQDEMEDGTTKTAYLFTCDETRYNIAPTTAIQHVYYAYYEMTIDMQKHTYTPQLAWEKVYDKTYYGNDKMDAMFGLKVTTESVSDDQGTHSGYVTVSQIKEYIEGRDAVAATYYTAEEAAAYNEANGLVSGADGSKKEGDVKTPEKPKIESALTGGDDAPSSKDQILYIDGSDLMNIVENTSGTTPQTLSKLKEGLAANALIYLPYGSTSSDDNFAYNTIAKYGQTPIFRGAGNIVLTDEQPFFSKYDIQVDAAKYAMYTRIKTHSDYGKDEKAMVILPFAMTLDGGKHINPAVTLKETRENPETHQPEQVDVSYEQGKNSFEVKEMKSASLTNPTPGPDGKDYGIAYFDNVSGNETVANRPYMVLVDKDNVVGDVSFMAIQNGATIKATTGMVSRTGQGENKTEENPNGNYSYDYLFTGETVDGSLDKPGKSVSLTSEGSYSGQVYDRADSEAIFYFADNRFYNLYRLNKNYRYLYAYPFHPVYSFTESDGVNSIYGLDITFDPFVVDYIQDVTKSFNPDLAVRSGKGFIQMTSDKNQTVDIRSLNGTSYSMVNMNAGDSKTVNLPAGVYLVNNVKIIVK